MKRTNTHKHEDMLKLAHRSLNRLLRAHHLAAAIGATEDEIDDLEKRIARNVPRALRQWLHICRGISVGGMTLYGVERHNEEVSIDMIMEEPWPRRNWIPVAGDDFGNHFCIVSALNVHADDGPVLFVEASVLDVASYVVGSSLAPFLVSFLEARERDDDEWPMNKAVVLSTDPALANVRGYPRPWSG